MQISISKDPIVGPVLFYIMAFTIGKHLENLFADDINYFRLNSIFKIHLVFIQIAIIKLWII